MIVELNKAFRGITYTDKLHKYYIDSNPVISVTQFLKKITKEFNTTYWSTYKALQQSGYQVKPHFSKAGMSDTLIVIDGTPYEIENVQYLDLQVDPNDIKRQWQIESLVGTTRGSFAHKYLENLEQGLLDQPEIILPPGLSTPHAVSYVRSIELVKNLCNQYVEENKHLIPIAIEYRVGDLMLGMAGTFDRLYWNEQTGEAEIHDFKTDKKIETVSKYKDKFKCFDIDVCEVNKYGLQTSLYKFIIEKNTNLKLGQSRITHLNLKDERLDYYDCPDYTKLLETDVNNWTTYV